MVEEIEALDNQFELPSYMINVFDTFGVSQEDKGENTIILKPTEHMLSASFPSLKEDGMTVTFDRDTALSQEDVHFISWDHPMVQGTMDMICDDDFGSASVALLKNKKLPLEERFNAQLKLAKLPRNSARTRIRNRCEITGRPHGVYRKLKISRIALRELASKGIIPGMTKSSW